MSHRCLADFLEELGQAGQLARVEAAVDPRLEAAEISRRTALAGGPALLFGAVSGHDMPLLTNLLATDERICRALGTKSLQDVAARIARLVDPPQPEGWFERLKTAPHVATLAGLPPRRVKAAACQQIVRLGSDVDLGALPLIQAAPMEAGRSIAAAATLTAEPDSHRMVAGRYDFQLLGPDRLAACWGDHDEPARLLREYAVRAQRLPLAIVLGGDPAVWLAASAPLPQSDTWALAGLLREKPIEVVPCRSVDLAVPADAEIILEGYVDPAEVPVEAGRLCTPSGHYGRARPAPVVRVTAMTHRANPVYPAALAHEVATADRALARLLLPLWRLAIPELVDCDLPPFGAARHAAVLSIGKSHAGQARRVASAAWGMRPWMFAKLLLLVDAEVDVRNPHEVLAAVAANVHPRRDVMFHQGPPDPVDPAADPGELGHRMAIDATRKLPGERAAAPPLPAAVEEETRRHVSRRWAEYGLGPEPNDA